MTPGERKQNPPGAGQPCSGAAQDRSMASSFLAGLSRRTMELLFPGGQACTGQNQLPRRWRASDFAGPSGSSLPDALHLFSLAGGSPQSPLHLPFIGIYASLLFFSQNDSVLSLEKKRRKRVEGHAKQREAFEIKSPGLPEIFLFILENGRHSSCLYCTLIYASTCTISSSNFIDG